MAVEVFTAVEVTSQANVSASVLSSGGNKKLGKGSRRTVGHGLAGVHQKAPAPHKNRTINRSISVAAESKDVAALVDVISSNIDSMNGLNLATSLHRLAKIAPSADADLAAFKRMPVFTQLFSAVVEHIQGHNLRTTVGAKGSNHCAAKRDAGEMPVQCLSIVAWSFASLKIRQRSCFEFIAEITAPRLHELKPYELSNLVWAFAKVGLSHCELFKKVADRLLTRAPGEFKVQCLSTIAWSFATLKRRNLTLFTNLAKELSLHVLTMKPQEMSNTLWAYAKNGYAQAELFKAIGDNIVRQAAPTHFKPQEISNSAWAFATVGIQHPALFAKIEEVSLKQREAVAPQNVANLIWAFAKLGVKPSDQFLGVLIDSTMLRMSQYKPPELSAVVWAMSQVIPQGNAAFFDVLAVACIDRIHEFSCNGVANLFNAFGAVEVQKPRQYVVLLKYGMSRLQHFLPRAVVTLAQGVAMASSRRSYEAVRDCLKEFMAEISKYILAHLSDFSFVDLKDLANLHSFQLLDLPDFRAALLSQKLPINDVSKRTQSLGSMSTAADEDVDFASEVVEETNPMSDCGHGNEPNQISRRTSYSGSNSDLNDKSPQNLFTNNAHSSFDSKHRCELRGKMMPAIESMPVFVAPQAGLRTSGLMAGCSFIWQADGQLGPMKVIVPSMLNEGN